MALGSKYRIIVTQDVTVQEQIPNYPNQTHNIIVIITRQTWKCNAHNCRDRVFFSLLPSLEDDNHLNVKNEWGKKTPKQNV